MSSYNDVPEEIKPCRHLMKLAIEHDSREIIIAYYARVVAVELALNILGKKVPRSCAKFLKNTKKWIENAKLEYAHLEGFINETYAKMVIQEYSIRLYEFAYNNDVIKSFDGGVVKAYYRAYLLSEILTKFGPLSEDMKEKSRISKYRARYIHEHLKNGTIPIPVNVIVIRNKTDEKTHLLTKNDLNARRIARGEAPLE